MHYPLPPETSAVAGGEVLATMAIKAPGRDLATANSLWVQAGLPLNRDFLADLDRHYGAALHPVDFERNDQTARLLINSWVEGKTGNRIKELLHPEDVSAGTKSVLVNAIYLKAQWATPFKIGATRAGPFRTLDGRTLPVPLMNLRSSFKVAARGGVQAIALPYRSGELEMVVLLPKSIGGLPRFERTLTAQGLAAWLKRLDEAEPADTILTLPRFRLEWRDDLVPTLVGLGMRVPMSDAGDFSGSKFVDPASSDPNDLAIKIGRVIHQTFLDVDENGSEAAAATAVVNIVVSGKRIAPPPPPPIIFRADRPFLFLIRDARTGAILFMGRMVAPPSDPPARAGGDG
jgi:serpin B